MSEDGYTLAEMLVALFIAGMAMTGLASAASIVARAETRAGMARAEAAAIRRLIREAGPMVAEAGPFEAGAEGAQGSPQDFTFPCGAEAFCGLAFSVHGERTALRVRQLEREMVVAFPAGEALRLGYVAAGGGDVLESWPGGGQGRLAAVILQRGTRPVAVLPLAPEQPAACVTDLDAPGCAPRGEEP